MTPRELFESLAPLIAPPWTKPSSGATSASSRRAWPITRWRRARQPGELGRRRRRAAAISHLRRRSSALIRRFASSFAQAALAWPAPDKLAIDTHLKDGFGSRPRYAGRAHKKRKC